jgi:hypothetical protein
VRHEDDRRPAAAELADPLEALPLKLRVAHRQHLVDQEDVRLEVHRDGEPEARVHARGVVLHRHIDELGEPRELHDLLVDGVGVAPREAEEGRVQVYVLLAGQIGLEAHAQLDHRGHAAPHDGLALRGPIDAREDAQ